MNVHKKILAYFETLEKIVDRDIVDPESMFLGFLDAFSVLIYITKEEKELYIRGYRTKNFKNIQVK
jgi:hypothetical protein